MPHCLLLAIVCAIGNPPWAEVQSGEATVLLHPKCRPLATSLVGPFVKLGDGSILAVDENQVRQSRDDGKTWSARPLFARPDKYQYRGQPALLRTRDGTLILAFVNEKERVVQRGGPLPEFRQPVHVTRSIDDGKTWLEPEAVEDGCCGALGTVIQLRGGRVVLACQRTMADTGRRVCFTYVSEDEGKTWRQSNVIDLGECGSNGGLEGEFGPTLAELRDGRLWMLIRTRRGCFTETYSFDAGLTWKETRPSTIGTGVAPGRLRRLQSGRLVLFWNQYIENEKPADRRRQLWMALSEDDGRRWTEPVVLVCDPARQGDEEPRHRVSYPQVHEHVPGELWVTTTHGPLGIAVAEDDFLPRRMSDKTYAVRHLTEAAIRLDGRDDDLNWSKAAVEKDFVFPWKDRPAPSTEFRALCDDAYLYFTFRIEDADVFVLDKFRDEEDAVFEDRAEIYFVRDDRMRDYYCFEIDSRGRAFDYRGSYYRRFDPAWTWKGLETKASPLPQGYVVEGRIPLESFEALGFPKLRPGVKIRCGLYRAEFSHDRSGRTVAPKESIHNMGRRLDEPPPIEAWMSWVDPKTVDPDFHVPTSLGWLEIVDTVK